MVRTIEVENTPKQIADAKKQLTDQGFIILSESPCGDNRVEIIGKRAEPAPRLDRHLVD